MGIQNFQNLCAGGRGAEGGVKLALFGLNGHVDGESRCTNLRSAFFR